MKNTIIKFHNNENYSLNCDITKLEEFGFVNSTCNDDIAPSYKNDNFQIFFFDFNDDSIINEKIKWKFILNIIIKSNDDEEELVKINCYNDFNTLFRMINFYNKSDIEQLQNLVRQDYYKNICVS